MGTQFFWIGLQNAPSPGPTTALIQPVLEWGQGTGPAQWEISSWAVYGCDTTNHNCTYVSTPPNAAPVTAGDTITGYLVQTAPHPNPAWQVIIYDNNTYAFSQLNVGFPGAWPRFNIALDDVFEGGINFTSCSQLSPTQSVTFNLMNLSEAGPLWNSFNNVLPGQPNAPSWQIGATGTPAPQCDWNIVPGGLATTVSWNLNP